MCVCLSSKPVPLPPEMASDKVTLVLFFCAYPTLDAVNGLGTISNTYFFWFPRVGGKVVPCMENMEILKRGKLPLDRLARVELNL